MQQSYCFTHTVNDREVVNHELSAEKTTAFLEETKNDILLVPGFIAQDEEGNTTTSRSRWI